MARSAAALERRKLKVALHSYPELFIAARANIGHVWLQLISYLERCRNGPALSPGVLCRSRRASP